MRGGGCIDGIKPWVELIPTGTRSTMPARSAATEALASQSRKIGRIFLAEESNSSFDIRNKFTGNALYELPFGPDTHRLTTGWMGHTLSNISVSTNFHSASGTCP